MTQLRTVSEDKNTYVVDCLCGRELETGVCFVDLLKICLQETTCDTTAEHLLKSV